jgi:N6-adenosine-specific RNA methylase IME4
MNLIKYDAACKAIAEAKSLDEVKDIADKAAALKEYARRAKNKQGEIDFAEVRMRAVRKWGQMYSEAEKHEGGRPITGNTVRPVIETPTLKDMGVDKRFSVQAQKIGAIPDDKYEELVGEWRDRVQLENERVTTRLIRESEKVAPEPAPPLPDGKYQVIYADPPWSYNDKCEDGAIQSGGAERHYPSMSINELINMGADKLAGDNSVLFLWATSPLLPDALEIMSAWGFTYKAAFIWDKIKHNMGHYNSVRHEILLIGTKGSCAPDNLKLFDSVQSIEKGKHSEKPEAFRVIIDTLYNGSKVELFHRGEVPKGWTAWGNECTTTE